jgi:hypothetical protein
MTQAMRKIFTLVSFSALSVTLFAQNFWTENFGTGCSKGQLVSAYTGTNGAWTLTTTGTNDSYADAWYVSATANGTGANNCATGCSNTNNRSLHIGNADLSAFGIPADSGSTYLTGALCSSFAICNTTHKRAMSPVINCSNKTNISLTCVYYENAELNGDFATLFYSPDGGTTWNSVVQMPQTMSNCTGIMGTWTSYTVALPSGANNNPNVKIAFNWINDNDGVGTDPSFAIDDIVLSQAPTGISTMETADLVQVYNSGNDIVIKTSESYTFISVTDMLGRTISTVLNDNTISFSNKAEGVYFVNLEVNGMKVTKKVLMQ